MLTLISVAVVSATPSLQLSWVAPADCPSAEQVLERLNDLPDGRPIDARAVVTHDAQTYRLSITFVAPREAERVLESASCDESADAAAFFVRLAREAPLEELTTREPPPPPPAPPPSGFLGVHVDATMLTLPAPALGGGLTGWLSFGRVAVRASLSTWAPNTFVGGPTLESEVRVQRALGGRLGVGVGFTFGALKLTPGLLLELEWWLVSGKGVSQPGRASAGRLGGGAFVGFNINVWKGLGLFVEPALALNLTQPQVRFDETAVASTGPVSISVRAGLGWVF